MKEPSANIVELMRAIDAYAFDCRVYGKTAKSRVGVEMMLHEVLPNPATHDILKRLSSIAERGMTSSPPECAEACTEIFREISSHLAAVKAFDEYFKQGHSHG